MTQQRMICGIECALRVYYFHHSKMHLFTNSKLRGSIQCGVDLKEVQYVYTLKDVIIFIVYTRSFQGSIYWRHFPPNFSRLALFVIFAIYSSTFMYFFTVSFIVKILMSILLSLSKWSNYFVVSIITLTKIDFFVYLLLQLLHQTAFRPSCMVLTIFSLRTKFVLT